jgi:hypothetical protein
MESEEFSESKDEHEDAEIGDEVEYESVEEKLAELSNLELAWEVLEVAKLGYSKAGIKAALAEVYLDLGDVSVENQDYGHFPIQGPGLKCSPTQLKSNSTSSSYIMTIPRITRILSILPILPILKNCKILKILTILRNVRI